MRLPAQPSVIALCHEISTPDVGCHQPEICNGFPSGQLVHDLETAVISECVRDAYSPISGNVSALVVKRDSTVDLLTGQWFGRAPCTRLIFSATSQFAPMTGAPSEVRQ